MSKKKATAIGWIIIAVCIVIGFIGVARSAIFGDASFSDIDMMGFIISWVSIVFLYLVISIFANRKTDDKK